MRLFKHLGILARSYLTLQSPSAMDFKSKSVILGSIVHSLKFGEVEIVNNGMLVYSNSGVIEQLLDLDKSPIDKAQLLQYKSVTDCTGKLILPGFIDAHCHAPQYVFSGTGMDLPLLAWLEKYTFPCEARFSDENFARTAYEKSIRRHLKSGTTFAAYFATIHNSGGKVLVDVINRVGQRAFVGKVSMDRNSPDFYIEETARGCEDAEEFARYVLALTPVGATFLRSIDLKTPLTAATLLEQSRTASARSLGRSSLSGGGNAISSGSSSPRNPSAASSSSSSSSAVKRPRSVSTGDETDFPLSRGPSSSGPPVAETFSTARARTISASDMDLYGGFEDDQYYESGRFNPDDYITSATSSLGDSGSAVRTLLNHPFTPLVLPCVTPRFVPTCTGEMLGSLGEIAAKYGLPVQSHLSESVGEIAWVKDLHPDCSNYASVYQKYGLLNEHCIMAHCCHSDAAERQLLAECNTAIVHCASSNFCLDSGVLDVHGCVAQGIRVGMGTDVAGGYSSSMLDALRQSIIASKVIMFESRGDLRSKAPVAAAVAASTAASAAVSAMEVCGGGDLKESSSTSSTTNETGNESDTSATFHAAVAAAADPMLLSDAASQTATDAAQTVPVPVPVPVNNKVRPLNYKEAFHLATVGGAEALGMGQVVGNFLPGKKLDCLVVDPAVVNGPFDLFDGEGVSEFFQKFLFLGDDRNIVKVFVDGRQVI